MVEKLRDRFVRFMYGRYGNDQLNKGLMIVSLFLLFFNFIVQSAVISGLVLFFIVVYNYRAFSKNIYRRQAENLQYRKVMKPVQKEVKLTIRKIKEGRHYTFRKCSSCGQVLRLKRHRGKHSTVCPKCRNKMEVHIRF